MKLHLDARTLRPSTLTPPPSKSDAQRALALAHALGLTEEAVLDGRVPDAALPADVVRTREGLRALRSEASTVDIDCGDGGAPFRILLAQAAATPGKTVRLYGTPRLAERPVKPLLDALEAALGPAGFRWRRPRPNDAWPLEVTGATERATSPTFEVDAALSSQFPTALLLTGATLAVREARPWTVALKGTLASAGYLTLTQHWLERAGFEVDVDGPTVRVVAPPRPSSQLDTSSPVDSTSPHASSSPLGTSPLRAPDLDLAPPGDWSSLGYLLPIAWRSGGTVARVDPSVAHPDREILSILEACGLTVSQTTTPAGETRVTGQLARGLVATGARCPDLLPTLAALACVCPASSRLEAVSILREKESDRLAGILELTRAFGAPTRHLEAEDALLIEPAPAPPELLRVDSRGDHRMAMAGATLAVLGGCEAEIDGAEHVSKSFPGFWSELEGAGARCRS